MRQTVRGVPAGRRKRAKKTSTFSKWTRYGLLAVVAYAGWTAYATHQDWTAAYSESDARVSIEIPAGTSVSGIAHILSQKEIIADAKTFEWYVSWHDETRNLQAGEYVLQQDLTYSEVVQALQNGRTEEIKITIPEGHTISQIDALLAAKELSSAGDFTACNSSEGSLFPSTYFVKPKTFTPCAFADRLQGQMNQILGPWKSDIEPSGRSISDILNVASMVEREAANDAEMPIIAGIIWKRLDINMHLGIDATTRYETNNWKSPLTYDTLQRDTPYNTRKRLGLPPTAIGNAGKLAIQAAIFPEKTEYLYYLHDRNGQIRYAKTLDGHNQNKNQYLR